MNWTLAKSVICYNMHSLLAADHKKLQWMKRQCTYYLTKGKDKSPTPMEGHGGEEV
jgi:hypothetical protein